MVKAIQEMTQGKLITLCGHSDHLEKYRSRIYSESLDITTKVDLSKILLPNLILISASSTRKNFFFYFLKIFGGHKSLLWG